MISAGQQAASAAHKPLITVILATYNGEKYLQEQLDSVLQQSYTNIEVVMVDDGSTDNTWNLIQTFAAQDARIRPFRNEKNLGYIRNFERGCQLAAGDYIALCDQDDYWLPEKLERQLAAIGNYPLLYCDSTLANETLQPTHERLSTRVNYIDFHSCLQQAVFCRIYGHTMLATKELIQKAIPFLHIIPHDWWICYLASAHGGIKCLNQPLALYRQHSNNVFGAVGGKRRKHQKAEDKQRKQRETEIARKRIQIFFEQCPPEQALEKKVLQQLTRYYSSFSLRNNCLRMLTFFRYNKLLLASKKRSQLRRWLFCFKTFYKLT